MHKGITKKDIEKLAKLSNLSIELAQAEQLTVQFQETLDVVSQLDQIDTTKVSATSQVTGLVNVFREDSVDSSRQFTQQQALANAKETYNGYFVVPAVINN